MWYGKGEIKYEEKGIPEIENDEVLIKVAYVGICASDIHIMEGRLPERVISPPQILGHEFSGEVVRKGKEVRSLNEGDRVVVHPWGNCGECHFCRRGQENLCTNPFNIVTNPRTGAFAEYAIAKGKQVYKLPMNISLDIAALVEPTSIAVHAMDLSNIKPGFSVGILGGGMIGIRCLQLTQKMGASVIILSEPIKFRREIARQLGADIVLDPNEDDVGETIRDVTDGLGVDTCIEAVGTQETCQQAMRLVKNGGTVLIVGFAPLDARISISPYEIYRKELTIRGSFWSPYAFERSIQLIKRIETKSLITHTFRLGEVEKALEVYKSKKCIKILLQPF